MNSTCSVIYLLGVEYFESVSEITGTYDVVVHVASLIVSQLFFFSWFVDVNPMQLPRHELVTLNICSCENSQTVFGHKTENGL